MYWEPTKKIEEWLFRKFRLGLSEVHGDTIIHYRRFNIVDKKIETGGIVSWQILQDLGIYWVAIKMSDGQAFELNDKYDCLVNILRKIHPDKELPWEPAS